MEVTNGLTKTLEKENKIINPNELGSSISGKILQEIVEEEKAIGHKKLDDISVQHMMKIYKICGDVTLIANFQEAENTAAKILAMNPIVLGLDIEATDNIAGIISLADRTHVYLFQCRKILTREGRLPRSLVKILTNVHITKIVNGTMDQLYLKTYGVYMNSVLNLQDMTGILRLPKGLKPLYKKIFPEEPDMIELYSKVVYIQINWHHKITGLMKLYAAHDARAVLLIYYNLLKVPKEYM